MTNEGKEEKETEKLGYIWWYQKNIMYSCESAVTPPASTAAALRYALDAPAKKTHSCLQTAAPRAWVDGLGWPLS